MRLRLRIERNALPALQAIWPVKNSKSTIAEFVQHINDVFPLEGDTWGLEDYSVTVGGYECLHYHEVGTVCRDEDEVVIRPLQYVDVRARTLTGRDQISRDGRHLVDGIPFGKPCLKAPVRPVVRIPPRKRRRLLEDQEEDDQDAPLMLMENEEELDEDRDEMDDGDFDAEESEADSPSELSTSDSESQDSDGSDSETSSSESESEESSDSGSDDDSWNGIANSAANTPSSNQVNGVVPNPHSFPATSKRKRQSDDQDEHELEHDHETKAAKLVETKPPQGNDLTKRRNARRRDSNKLKHLKKMQVLPQNANLETLHQWQQQKEGNAQHFSRVNALEDSETREAQALTHVESQETAAGGSNHAMDSAVNGSRTNVAQVPTTNGMIPPVILKKKLKKGSKARTGVDKVDGMEDERQKLLNAIASGGVDITNERTSTETATPLKFMHKEQKMSAPPTELSSKQHLPGLSTGEANEAVERELDSTGAAEQVATPRRSQLDLAATKRLLFGNLGVRAPKTQEERDRVQRKLAERPKRNVSSSRQDDQAPATTQEGDAAAATVVIEVAEDEDSWMNKIHLTAIECCDEGVTLSTPPFPFHQRWDSQYQRKKKGRTSDSYMSNTSKNRHGKQNQVYVESYDKYNTDGYGDVLDYDDVNGGTEDEYWEEGALLDGAYDGEEEVEQQDHDHPPLPANLDQLPQLADEHARVGDFIAFKELACDDSTGWQPKTVTRTAKIVEKPKTSEENRSWVVQLSTRDLKPKVFDEEGNRVYSKFEMPDQGTDDEPDDEGTRELTWSELGDVKLLLRPDEEGNDTV